MNGYDYSAKSTEWLQEQLQICNVAMREASGWTLKGIRQKYDALRAEMEKRSGC